MTATLYINALRTATKLLTNYGQPVTVTRAGVSAYDPTTTAVTASPVVETTVGVIMDFSAADAAAAAGRSGQTLIQEGDRKVILSANGLTSIPKPGDILTIASADWSVIACRAVDPAGAAVIYTAQVRGG